MNYEFSNFEYFFEVASCGTITGAAMQLHITQPALSKAIANMEEQYHCKLLNRTTKGVTLTEQGQVLFKCIKQSYFLLNAAKNKIHELNDHSIPEVSIGAGNDITSFFVLTWLNTFKQKCPNTVIKIMEARSLDIIKAVKQGEVDIGIQHTRIQEPSLEFYKLFEMDYCLAVGEQFRFLTGPSAVSINTLVDFPFILFPPQSVKRKHINAFFRTHNISIKPRYEAGNANLIIQMAESNMGIAIIPRLFVAAKLKAKVLYEVELKEQIPPDQVWLTWKKNTELTHSATSLLRHFKEQGTALR
jgi:DNA-binding transcriptional LysR family regulator